MLEPDDRHYFSDLLSPPADFRLEKAVGATYSLELPAVLMAPIAMTQRSVEGSGPTGPGSEESRSAQTPVSLVEAIRRISDRIALLCQRGRIEIPDAHSELYAFLDDAILELNPADGAFHPKFWMLHFRNDDEDRFRLVCTSRNLAYNRTWDAVVALEDAPAGEHTAEAAPLAEFLRQTSERRETDEGSFGRSNLLDEFADDIEGVAFRAPAPFDDASLRLRGWETDEPLYASHPNGDPRLLISPFVSRRAVEESLDASEVSDEPAVLVSRQQTLDELRADTGADWPRWSELDCRVLAVDEALQSGESEDDLAGLHAKVYAAENENRSTWRFTSANLTEAAMAGGNIEFGVDLAAPTPEADIRDVLRTGEDRSMGLGNLLEPYHPADDPPDPSETDAERAMADWRSYFADGELVLDAEATTSDDKIRVVLEFNARRDPPAAAVETVQVWPSSLSQEVDSRSLDPPTSGDAVRVDLGDVTPLRLTPFVAFAIEPAASELSTLEFALGARLEGLELDRGEVALEHLIRNQDRFLRYLRYLLADVDDYWAVEADADGTESSSETRPRSRGVELPLMEDLVEKCVADPAKVDAIHSLIRSVQELDREEDLVPEAFLQDLWLPVLRAVKPELVDEYRD